ncbi:MAG: hypothetical protein ACRDQB_03100 [Thermocrispum sp.]
MLLLFAAAVGVALLQNRLVERVQASTPAVKRWSGRVLILLGLWFVALGAFSGVFGELFPA